MQIVIDISEDDLDAIKYLKVKGWASRHELLILNGTPLEKIRDEILKLDDPDYDFEGYYKAVTDALAIIDKYRGESI